MSMGGHYHRPQALSEVLPLLGRPGLRLLAGGTDFFPARADQAIDEDVLDLSAVAGFGRISRATEGAQVFVRLGAMVTWSQVLTAPQLQGPAFQALRQAAREIGARQIQNRGTLVGNLCNASPAADGVPCLMALGARVEIASARGIRLLPVEAFVLGPRRTALAPDEVVCGLLLPQQERACSLFLKMGTRRYLVISIAMLAAQWTRAASTAPGSPWTSCRVSVGACSAVAVRLTPFEQWACAGMPAARRDEVFKACLALLSPIDDVRADRVYRLNLVTQLLSRLQAEMLTDTGT